MNSIRLPYIALLALVILLFYGAFLALWLGGHQEILGFWADSWGVGLVTPSDDPQARSLPFFDLYGVLSWRDCHLRGLDVLSVNPCDPLNRPSNYSPLLYLLPTGGRENLLVLGFLLVGTFLALLPLLLRPVTRGELAISALAATSCPLLFAVERANLDILMFLMALLAIWLWRSGRGWPAYGVILAAGFLKFYPLALLALAAREPVRRLAWIASICIGLIALFIAIFRDALVQLPALMPDVSYFGNEFGAKLFGLGVTEELGLPSVTAPLLTLLLAALCLWGALRTAAILGPALERSSWNSRETALLLGGALLTIGCFLPMVNIGYRAIFLILTLPGFFLLRRMAQGPARLAGWGLAAILFCLYSELFRQIAEWLRDATMVPDRPGPWDDMPEVVFFLVREAAWWFVVTLLSGIFLAFLRRTPVLVAMRGKSNHA
jgi:hypothetical protein